jgi:prepilin-type N-terminal cleavage/methylation domain-containing protein
MRPLTRLPPPRKPSSRGYTAVEVLMAMTIMTIGAAAVMSMQKASIQGNLDARKTDAANAIARTWVERLQRDAMQWTLPNAQTPTGNNFANALLLSSPTYGQWSLPSYEMGKSPDGVENMSYAFDILGRDLPTADVSTETIFCVSYRLQWLVPQALPIEPGLIRADVRVLWTRGISDDPAPGWCTTANMGVANPDPTFLQYRSIYLTTDIRQGAQ